MSLTTITVDEAKKRLADGAVLVDVRENDEVARERIPGARHAALSGLTSASADGASAIIFHCKSGGRTAANAGKLADAATCEAFVLEGGIEAWKRAGLPIESNAKAPLEIMRQVQIAAGVLIVAGALLGWTVGPAFHALSAAAGAGLLFAGVTGWCGMATILGVMPWNRRPT